MMQPGELLTVTVPCVGWRVEYGRPTWVDASVPATWRRIELELGDGGGGWSEEPVTPGRRLEFVAFDSHGDVIVLDHLTGCTLEVARGNVERWEGGQLP